VSGAFTKALLLVLHEFVGLVSVDRPVAQVAGIGGCVSRTTGLPLANADLHIEHSLCVDAEPQWSKCLLLRLRGGKKEVKKKTKGKRIKQPRKLADIRKKDDDSKEEQESDFFSTSLSFEQLTAKGPQSSVGTRQASSATLALDASDSNMRVGREGPMMSDDSSIGGSRDDAEAQVEGGGPNRNGVKVFAAASARRRPREDVFDKGLYEEMAFQEPKKVFLPQAPKTVAERMDELQAMGWKTPKETPKARVLREKAERAARREARGLTKTSVAGVGVEEGREQEGEEDAHADPGRHKAKGDKGAKKKAKSKDKGRLSRDVEMLQDRLCVSAVCLCVCARVVARLHARVFG
jgi:hypothetical protein